MDVLGGIVMIAGAVFVLIGGIGVVRFDNVFARMHAAAKAPTLGLGLVCLGVALTMRSINVSVTVLLILALQLIAGPVGTHVISRSVYQRGVSPLSTDELGEAAVRPGTKKPKAKKTKS